MDNQEVLIINQLLIIFHKDMKFFFLGTSSWFCIIYQVELSYFSNDKNFYTVIMLSISCLLYCCDETPKLNTPSPCEDQTEGRVYFQSRFIIVGSHEVGAPGSFSPCICNEETENSTESHNQSKYRIVIPSTKGYIYKIFLYLRLREHLQRCDFKSQRIKEHAVRFFSSNSIRNCISKVSQKWTPKPELNKGDTNGPANLRGETIGNCGKLGAGEMVFPGMSALICYPVSKDQPETCI